MFPGDSIIQEECESYGIDRETLLGKSHKAHLVDLRHIIAFRLRNELKWSLPRIANKLNRDHSSIFKLLKKPVPECLGKIDIKSGSMVRHKTGGPEMAVNKIDVDGMASCVFCVDGQFVTKNLHIKTLERIDDEHGQSDR